ncbi:ribose 5-phosphate isomerase B [Chloroflexota bacterium]
MRIAIGNDHRGIDYKEAVLKILIKAGHEHKDFGTNTADAVDYPDIAGEVGNAVVKGDVNYGILICGTGIGMCISANKIKGIRAAMCRNVFDATRARQHNNANILCLGAEYGLDDVADMVNTFLTTDFEGGRHQSRIDKIKAMEDQGGNNDRL